MKTQKGTISKGNYTNPTLSADVPPPLLFMPVDSLSQELSAPTSFASLPIAGILRNHHVRSIHWKAINQRCNLSVIAKHHLAFSQTQLTNSPIPQFNAGDSINS